MMPEETAQDKPKPVETATPEPAPSQAKKEPDQKEPMATGSTDPAGAEVDELVGVTPQDQGEDKEEEEEEAVAEEKSAIFETRVETAEARKAEGNVAFKSQDWEAALKAYRSGLYHVEFDEMSFNFELMDDHREMVNAVRLPLLLNAAACSLKLATDKSIAKALEFCEEALKIEQQNPKALFRKGQALLKQEKVEKAVEALKGAAKAAPGDKLIRSTLATALKEIKSQNARSDAFWKEKLKPEMASMQEVEEDAGAQEKRSVCHTLLDRVKALFVNPPQAVRDA